VLTHVLVVLRLGDGERWPVVGLEPLGQDLGVQGDERGDERLPVADDDRLGDQRVPAQGVLHHRGGDVLPPGRDDDLLLAAGDGEVTVRVQVADVAGVEPPVSDGLGGGLGVVVVALEDADTLDEDLAVLRDADGRPGERLPDRSDASLAGQVEVGGCCGLGEAVALQHVHADALEEVAEPLAERRTAGDGPVEVAAEDLADLRVDEAVGEVVLQLE